MEEMSEVFQDGDRVRLAVEFVGNIWVVGPDLYAGEGDGPNGKGEPITVPAGSTGTIAPGSNTSPQSRYVVIMDGRNAIMEDSRLFLVVRSANLERIPGRTRVVWTGADTFLVEQVFHYQDVVRLRTSVTTEDGSVYEAGTLGDIIPMDFRLSQAQNMEVAWETGVYPVRLSRYDVTVNIPAAFLQLDSDFQPSDR